MSGAEDTRIALPQGHALAVRSWGNPARAPLLALHGWLDNAGSFDRIAPLLACDRHVVAPDLRGHGRSDHFAAGTWPTYIDWFDDVLALYAHFGWSRADLLGHSLGGTVLSLFAALYPDRVGRLLLVEALGPLTSTAEESLPQLRRALEQRAAYPARRALRVFPHMEQAISVRMHSNDLSQAAARCLVERGVRDVDGGVVWSSDPRLTLASAQRFTEAQVLAMLPGIVAPTLLILAEPATSYLPSEIMQARAARLADVHTVRIPGNHHLHLEQPDAVADIIRQFERGE
jgi:pimeloyl-ACP methyl ester carboxylesterase